MNTAGHPYRVSIYLVPVDLGPRAGDALGPYDASEFGAIERGKEALMYDGAPAGRQVYRIAGAADASDAREKAIAAWGQGPGEGLSPR